MTLISRLEAATEGSRELNCRIKCALEGNDFALFERVVPDLNEWANITPFTTSIDAALTLVPDGMWPVLDCDPVQAEVELMRRSDESDNGYAGVVYVEAATPALAICIASLKAREMGK